MARLRTILAIAIGVSAGTAAHASTYLPGFEWDWRTDFGTPSSIAELPPNPSSDLASRSDPGNAGLSSGPVATDVWRYGNAPYGAIAGGTFTSGDFSTFQFSGMFSGIEGVSYFWSDSPTLEGNWDAIGYGSAHHVNADAVHSQATVLRWKYPGSDPIVLKVTGLIYDFQPGSDDGVDVYLLKNSSDNLLATTIVPDGESRTLDVSVAILPGDELFLAVGYITTDYRDNTALDVVMRVVPEPSVGAFLLAGALLAAMTPKRSREFAL